MISKDKNDEMEKEKRTQILRDTFEKEEHVEIIGGKTYITDKTTEEHNNAVLEIATEIKNYIKANNGTCKVNTENVALYCNELCDDAENYFLPDIMVVDENAKLYDDGVHSAPVFVAEVTSDASRVIDSTDKMYVYRQIGVKEYWVVDMKEKRIVRYLEDKDFMPEFFGVRDTKSLSLVTYPSVEIKLSDIFGGNK